MQFVTLNGVSLHYRTVGDVRARPLIAFVNSLGTDFRIWDDVVARLGSDFGAVLYDERGHGLSSIGTPPYRMDDHAADLAALIDHVGAQRAILCGVSMGGQVAMALSALRPDLVAALVLCDTAPRIGDDVFWNARIAAIDRGGLAAIVDGVMERWFAASFRSSDNALYIGCRAMFARQPADGYIGSCIAVREAELTAAARRIKMPTVCVVGENDGSTPPALVRSLADLIPGARYEIISGAGHLPCVEQPAALAEIVRTLAAGLEMESMSHVPS